MNFKDRIKELRRVKARDLVANAANWRTHPESQKRALSGVMEEVGFADAVLARELPDGRLEIIDGHCRTETVPPDYEVPVLVLDVTEAEAKKLLATLDPLAAMAGMDAVKLQSLVAEIESGNEAVQQVLQNLNAEAVEAAVMQSAQPEAGAAAPPRDYTAGQKPQITYVLVFDDLEQQRKWYAFLKRCRAEHPADTIAASLAATLDAEGFAE